MPTFRGKPACSCQVEWIPAYEAEAQRRGILAPGQTLTIYQLIGGAPQSGGTHTDGGAGDFLDLPGEEDLWLMRQMGADASWLRPKNWDGKGGIKHVHSVLRGCPHNGPARYQYDSPTQGVDHGRDGLSHGGRGAPDDGPRPLSYRTWREGIAWAEEQGDEMPNYLKWEQADRDALAADVAKAVLEAKPEGSTKSLGQTVKETLNKVKALGK